MKDFIIGRFCRIFLTIFILLIFGGVTLISYGEDNGIGVRLGHHTKINDVFKNKKVRELILAAARGKIDEVNTLVKEGVNVNTVGKGGMTPLSWVICQNPINLQGFEALLKNGANPNYVVPKGLELYGASVVYDLSGMPSEHKNATAALELALKYGGNPNVINPNNDEGAWQSSLMSAAELGRIDNIKLLLKYGAKLEVKDETGMTALLWAAYNNHYNEVYSLLQHGANYHVKAGFPGKFTFIKYVDDPNLDKPLPKLNLIYLLGVSLDVGIAESQVPWRDKVIKWLEARGVPRPKPHPW